MGIHLRARHARLLAVALAGVALVAALGGSVAFAADAAPLDPAALQQLFDQLQSAPVSEATCRGCHANISDTDNYSSAIIFTHGNHILLQCSACHTEFPHRPEGTTRPTMIGCFACHGLTHGGMGELAAGECEDCHVTPKERLRPSFHPWDWRGEPHVEPANQEFNTLCTMCHDQASCDDCHDRENIDWAPASWAFDSESGCLSCHSDPLLQKAGASGARSFQVSGLEDSVHSDVTCQQCHIDYRYDGQRMPSPLFTINAGQACADCHAAEEDPRLSEPVAEYNKSTHAQAVENGSLDSATCGSCHGGHFIFTTTTAAGAARMHQSAYRVCARCKQHGDEYETYNDYYHGKAYKAGAPDAPACWDCHNDHNILPSTNPDSAVSQQNLGDTCGTEGCHLGSTEEFGLQAGDLIHQQAEAQSQNALLRLIARVFNRE